jgi:hypothetical protein
MPETSSHPQSEPVVPEHSVTERVPDTTDRRAAESGDAAPTATLGDRVTEQVYAARDGLAILLDEAQRARVGRAEAAGAGGAVCAWNHFENIPTFYNWNNRPR